MFLHHLLQRCVALYACGQSVQLAICETFDVLSAGPHLEPRRFPKGILNVWYETGGGHQANVLDCLEISEFGQELAASAFLAFIQCIDHNVYGRITRKDVSQSAVNLVERWLGAPAGMLLM
jgi:hypothetical protein